MLCSSDIILSCSNKITGGISHRASDQVERRGLSPHEYWFFIILSVDEIDQIMLSRREIRALVWDITNLIPAVRCHLDMVCSQVQDSTVYLWELAFRLIGTQGLAMEKHVNLGTNALRLAYSLDSTKLSSVAVTLLKGPRV